MSDLDDSKDVPPRNEFESVRTDSESITSPVVRAWVDQNGDTYQDYPVADYNDAIDAVNAAMADDAGRIQLPQLPGHQFSTTLNWTGNSAEGTTIVGPGADAELAWEYTGNSYAIEIGGFGNDAELRDWAVKSSGTPIIGISDNNAIRCRFSNLRLEETDGTAEIVDMSTGAGEPDNCHWDHCHFVGGTTQVSGVGVSNTFRDCNWTGFYTTGLALDSRVDVTVIGGEVRSENNPNEGVLINGTREWTIIGINIEGIQDSNGNRVGPAVRMDGWKSGKILNSTLQNCTQPVTVASAAPADTERVVIDADPLKFDATNALDAGGIATGWIHIDRYDEWSLTNDTNNRVVGRYKDGRTVAHDPDDAAKYIADPSGGGWALL